MWQIVSEFLSTSPSTSRPSPLKVAQDWVMVAFMMNDKRFEVQLDPSPDHK